ncbi:unnamed protein product [Alternaria alternata]
MAKIKDLEDDQQKHLAEIKDLKDGQQEYIQREKGLSEELSICKGKPFVYQGCYTDELSEWFLRLKIERQ